MALMHLAPPFGDAKRAESPSPSPGSTTAPSSPGFNFPSPSSRRPSVDLTHLAGDEPDHQEETLHAALQESLDSMAGALSRLRGGDMVSVIEDGEMTVLGFAPTEEIVRSLRRSEELANEILADQVPSMGRSNEAMEKQLLEKDLEIRSLRRELQESRELAQVAQAKLCRAESQLRVREQILKSKNEDISMLRQELVEAAQHRALSTLQGRRLTRSDDSELQFLRRQCKLLEEMNQELREDRHAKAPKAPADLESVAAAQRRVHDLETSCEQMRGHFSENENHLRWLRRQIQLQDTARRFEVSDEELPDVPAEPVAMKPEKEENSGALPSISRAAAKALA